MTGMCLYLVMVMSGMTHSHVADISDLMLTAIMSNMYSRRRFKDFLLKKKPLVGFTKEKTFSGFQLNKKTFS